jgi:transposase
MSDPAAEIRATLAALGKRGRTTPIPDEVRAMVVRYAGQQRRRDVSWRTIASELGLSASAMQRWAKLHERQRPRRAAAMVPVKVRKERLEERGLAVVTPSGVRVEGLSLEAAVHVLQRLG